MACRDCPDCFTRAETGLNLPAFPIYGARDAARSCRAFSQGKSEVAGSHGIVNGSSAGIAFILLGMFAITVNDMLIKLLSDSYPLHQMVFVRSLIGILFSLILVRFEGGWTILRPRRPFLHLLRGLAIVGANMAFFTALAVLPLADATAMFFVAPLFISLLAVPILGEKVGVRRLAAVLVGFAGVLIMVRPGAETADIPARWVLAMPVVAALLYACMQILTRKLGVASKASAMAVYIQATFLMVSGGFFLIAGDGRYAEGVENESLVFLLRAWVWPEQGDLMLFLLLGVVSAVVAYSLSQAYRLGDAATIAPYEYVAMPLAILWGWLIFGMLPGANAAVGILLITGAGIYVFFRERVRKSDLPDAQSVRRY